MTISGWIQLVLFVVALLAITKPMGIYLCKVLDADGRTFLDPVMKPIERLMYKLTGVDPHKEQDWKHYTLAMLLFSAVGLLFTYAILRLQAVLPLQHLFNPQNLPAVGEHLAFNTAASFTTNTNWQSYGGESTMSYLSQMVALTFHNWVSAATGIAIAAALVRGIARHTAKTIGNFWTDLTRVSLYLMLPICLIYSIFLVSQGMIQNFKPYTSASLVEPFTAQVPKLDESGQPVSGADGQPVLVDSPVNTQSIVQGPMASQIAIKMLGTNGGGYVNANAAHPFENPTPLSNFLQMLSIFAIPSGLTWYLGRTVKNQGHGWAVWAAMFVIFLAGVIICWQFESAGNPNFTSLGIDPADGNMEGKEVRFGIFNSALFADSYDRRLVRRSEFDARFLHPVRRIDSPVEYPAGRSCLWRRRRRPLWHAHLCGHRGLHRRPHGRTHSRVPRKKNRTLRRENGVFRNSHPRVLAAWLLGLGLN